jgi:hypothetical protein
MQLQTLLELANNYPDTAISIVLVVGGTIWHIATTYTNFLYIRKSMITKKDLEISLLKFENRLDNKYISREACAMMIKRNGDKHD